jgi:hypothetical protein
MFKVRYYKILLTFICLIPVHTGISAFAADSISVVQVSTAERIPGPGFIEAFKQQKKFNYAAHTEKINLFGRFIRYLKSRYRSVDSFFNAMPTIFKVIFWGFALFCLYLVVSKTKLYRVFYSIQEIEQPEFSLAPLHEADMNFDSGIRELAEQQQHRAAIRLLYLKLIASLKGKGLIRYSKNKTNFDYLNELEDPDLKSGFIAVTRIFNQVWYGDLELDTDQYTLAEKCFQTVYHSIDEKE